ncbi:MAG: tRNA (guanosine(37)-N1)-methyltransferase TrmD [Xanthomonadaceae bacterium]|nr:tRNA (guanosine(37)-N1)-methyltransferase TrmD [Xanthomonadaceae bacterium]
MLTEIHVVTLFPDWIRQLSTIGLTGKALSDGRITLRCFNPRDYAAGAHRSVDDRPYGGGPGMVMRPEPLALAIQSAAADSDQPVAVLSPQGMRVDQRSIERLAGRRRLILVCGRYEGIDERVVDELIDEEWSLGDFVLSGGEYAAAAIIDASIRLQPGVLGHEQSAEQDSFSQGLLDCPHYTRPEIWRDRAVPEVLLSGDHAAIKRWRRRQSLLRTLHRRPDLLQNVSLDETDRRLLAETEVGE